MSSPSNLLPKGPVERLVAKLVIAAVAVAVTAAIAFNDRTAAEPRHSPLAETATSASDNAQGKTEIPVVLDPAIGP